VSDVIANGISHTLVKRYFDITKETSDAV